MAGGAAAQTSDDFFNPEVLQRVELWMNSKDWDKLKAAFQENTYYPADVTWNGQTVRNVGIRSRGLGSRSGTKPGLRVDFDRYSTDQTFLGLKSFVLDNLTQDKSGVRETVAMRFFTRMGIPAPRETHTRLYVNGDYAGLYGAGRVGRQDHDGPRVRQHRRRRAERRLPVRIQLRDRQPVAVRVRGLGARSLQARFDIKTNESKGDATIWGPIEELVRLVNSTASASFEQPSAHGSTCPRSSATSPSQNFIAQNDGFNGYDGMNNFYFYRLENSTSHVFIAWDEDNAFLAPDFQITTRLGENVLTRNTLQVPAFNSQYYSVLLEAADVGERLDAAGDCSGSSR